MVGWKKAQADRCAGEKKLGAAKEKVAWGPVSQRFRFRVFFEINGSATRQYANRGLNTQERKITPRLAGYPQKNSKSLRIPAAFGVF